MAVYLFNTYTSLNGTAAETLSAYNSLTLIGNKNSLIFDTKRKSIWAKGIEYGYQASNISSDSISTFLPGYTITASGSAGTNVTGGTYTYISGISFTQAGIVYFFLIKPGIFFWVRPLTEPVTVPSGA